MLGPGNAGGNFKLTLPLEAGKRYLGAVNSMLGTARKGTTTLEVDTSEPLPKVNSVHAGVRAFVD
ncbi:hypothetical protein [Duganella sp. BuS-21]|uniref:hypothetical protein n=1 Tax=Duganella sp. BuS-21 TaxID=2943848 RepID=UPI0035A5C8A4